MTDVIESCALGHYNSHIQVSCELIIMQMEDDCCKCQAKLHLSSIIGRFILTVGDPVMKDIPLMVQEHLCKRLLKKQQIW